MDYFSHTKDGYGTDGLPLKNAEAEEYCENCDADINVDNQSQRCRGCNTLGCEKCMVKQSEWGVYLCAEDELHKWYAIRLGSPKPPAVQLECYCEFLENTIDELKAELREVTVCKL